MSRRNKGDYFWISYSDLMTTLFFVMLVLFVLTVVHLNIEKGKIEATLMELEKVVQLKEQFKQLEEDEDFVYLEECKKFVIKDLIGKEIFEPNQSKIKNEYINQTKAAGLKIESFLSKLQADSEGFSYLLVIEGNMANTWDRKYNENADYGYKISYERALAVYDLWLKNDISFRKKNVEVVIVGSGFNGLCRDKIEENNKRFSIQIIPKVSNIK